MMVDKPTYLIDREVCVRNVRAMKAKAVRSGVIFRPHFKTHQSRTIGRWFREEGIDRITVSSISAARWFAGDGWEDITVAFPVNLNEMGAINELAGSIRLGLVVEDLGVAKRLDSGLNHPVDCFIKIDTGYHRTGLTPAGMPRIIELAGFLKASGNLRIKGLLTHAGHTYHAGAADQIKRIYSESTRKLIEVRNALAHLGSDLVLSWGDTPSCSVLDEFPDIDEIRPGNFVFYDLMQLKAAVCSPGQVAGVVVCPVVAVHPERNQAILYGGAVHFSKDSMNLDGRRVFGQLVNLEPGGWSDPVEGAFLVSLSQEHGVLEAPSGLIRSLEPGNLVGIIPVHSCLTAHALGGYLLRGGGEADYLR